MPRMYVRPESGSRSSGRYLNDNPSQKKGMRQIHSDATNFFTNRNVIIRRGGPNDVRGHNNLGRAFKPFAGPEDILSPTKHIPAGTEETIDNPFPLKSNRKTIPEFKNGVTPGASIQMRLSDRKAHNAQFPADKQAKNLDVMGKTFRTLPPPSVALGDRQAVKEYVKSDPNAAPDDKPNSIDMGPSKKQKKDPALENDQHEVISDHDKNLPALIERNDYLPDGSRLVDRKASLYENTGYENLHHKMGLDVFKIINKLEPFIQEQSGEIRKLGQVPLDYHDKFKAAPPSPLRLFLKSKGFDIEKIDSLLKRDRLFFRNNDFSLKQVKAMDELIQTLEPLAENGGEFERFLKIVPEENRKGIKEPYDVYTKRMIETLRETTATYKKDVQGKSQNYIRRILLDHENAKKLDSALKDLGQLKETKNTSFLLDHYRNIAQSGSELLKVLRTATSYSQGTVFNHPELLKYTSEIPPMTSHFLKALKQAGDDERLGKYPDFSNKYSDLIFVVDKMLQGPLDKDLDIWHKALKQANPIPTNSTYTKKAADIMKILTPQVAPSMPKTLAERSAPAIMNKAPTKQSNGNAKDKKSPPISEKDYLKYVSTLPQPYDLVRPLGASEQVRPAPFDDPFLRETQNLSEWSDYASKMKAKIDSLNQIGNTIQEMALTGTGRPDPEYVALARRQRRLTGLKNLMEEIPKANKAARDVEEQGTKAQQDYVEGVGRILSGRLKLQAEDANQRASLDQMAAKSATGLANKALETEMILKKQRESLFNNYSQVQDARDANTWKRIKSIAAGFKY